MVHVVIAHGVFFLFHGDERHPAFRAVAWLSPHHFGMHEAGVFLSRPHGLGFRIGRLIFRQRGQSNSGDNRGNEKNKNTVLQNKMAGLNEN